MGHRARFENFQESKAEMLKGTERMHFGTLVGETKQSLRTRCSRIFEKLQTNSWKCEQNCKD